MLWYVCKCSLLLLLLIITMYLKDHCGKSTHDQAKGLGKPVLTLTVPVQSLSILSMAVLLIKEEYAEHKTKSPRVF